MKIYLKLILITLFCVQASVAEEVAPVFQVFIKELAEYETREVQIFVGVHEKESGRILWTSETKLVQVDEKLDSLLDNPDKLSFDITTIAKYGVIEFRLDAATFMADISPSGTQLEVKGLARDPNGPIYPFFASIVPVPLSVKAMSSETVSESGIRKSSVVEEIQNRNNYLKRKNHENKATIDKLKEQNSLLLKQIEDLKLAVERLQESAAESNYYPSLDLDGGGDQHITLRPWEYIRSKIRIPNHLVGEEVNFLGKNEVTLDPDNPLQLPENAYSSYVVFSNKPEVLNVNLGQWEGATDTEVTLQAGGFPGKADVFIVRLDEWIDYLNTEQEFRRNFEPAGTFFVDIGGAELNETYPFVNSDANGYTPDGERWGGAVDGNSSQSLFFGNATKYVDRVKTNNNTEDFLYQYVIFATADSDASFVDGSLTNYVSAAIQQIRNAHDPAQVDVTAEEFYEQTSYGKSSLRSALPNPLVVDLSAAALLPEELQQQFTNSIGNEEVLMASRAGWKFADLGFSFKKNHYSTHTKPVGIDIGSFDEWVTNGRPEIKLKLRETENNEGEVVTSYEEIENGFFKFKYLETLRLEADPVLTNLYVTADTYGGDIGEMVIGDNEDWLNYRTFIEGLSDNSAIENTGDENISLFDIVGNYQPVSDPPEPAPAAPANLNMYFHFRPSGIAENRVIVFRAPLKLTYRTHNWGRSRLTELALKEIVNNKIQQAGQDADEVDSQIWLFPAIIDDNSVTNIVWATGGNFISAGSHDFGNANGFSALMIHEMGHNIQKFSDHYWAEKYNHSASHQGRKVGYYDMMSNQGTFSDHVLASKVSRKWIASDKVEVVNPLLLGSGNSHSTNLLITNRYKLANLNDLDLTNALNNDPELKAGVEIRLADGNNLTVEYRATNTNGFKLQPYASSWGIDALDAEANYTFTNNMRNPAERFKVLETWGNLGNGENTYAAVKSGAAQPPVLLAPSDFDTIPTNLNTNNTSAEVLTNLSADEAWVRKSWPLVKSDGPFLLPSKPDQELILDNISEDQLLEKMTIRPGNNYNNEAADLEVIYERYNRSSLVNSGADPSILPQEQCCSWQSADIEIINAKSINNESWKNLPWPEHDNQIKVTIRNNTDIPAQNVRVQLSVMDYQVQAGSRRWAVLGMKTLNIEANSQGSLTWEPDETRGIFTVDERHRDSQSYHKCIQAKILPWEGQIELEGEIFVFQEQGPALSNNIAESNYTWKKSQAASPAEIVTIPLTMHNDYEESINVNLSAWPNHKNFFVFNPEPSFFMEPFSSKTIEVGIQYSPGIDPNSKNPIKEGFVSFSAYATGPASDELGKIGGPHDNDILIGGALAKIFGGRKINLTLEERSKVLIGIFKDTDGNALGSEGTVSVYLGTNINAEVLTTRLDGNGEFEFTGKEFTDKIFITLNPDESSEFGFFEQEFQALP